MMRRLVLCIALLGTSAPRASVAATTVKDSAASTAAGATGATKNAATGTKSKNVATARKPATRSRSGAARAPRPASAKSKAEGPRTLDDIRIEGEIAVPQVLFITARDQRRFMDFQHHRFLRTSRQIGDSTALPSRIAVTETAPAPAAGKATP